MQCYKKEEQKMGRHLERIPKCSRFRGQKKNKQLNYTKLISGLAGFGGIVFA